MDSYVELRYDFAALRHPSNQDPVTACQNLKNDILNQTESSYWKHVNSLRHAWNFHSLEHYIEPHPSNPKDDWVLTVTLYSLVYPPRLTCLYLKSRLVWSVYHHHISFFWLKIAPELRITTSSILTETLKRGDNRKQEDSTEKENWFHVAFLSSSSTILQTIHLNQISTMHLPETLPIPNRPTNLVIIRTNHTQECMPALPHRNDDSLSIKALVADTSYKDRVTGQISVNSSWY